jgi:hypothetical protein
MNSKTLIREATTVLKNTHISDDYDITDWIPDQGRLVMTKGEDTFASYSDTSIDSSELSDGEPRQFEQIDVGDEFKNTKLENLVRSEGSQQILQLILQE